MTPSGPGGARGRLGAGAGAAPRRGRPRRRALPRGGRLRTRALAAGLLAAAAALSAGPLTAAPAAAAGDARAWPAPGALPSTVRQLIIVTASSYHTTYAELSAYRRSGDRWIAVYGPWRARIGYNGMAPPGKKREGDGRTPSGTYGFGFFFGVEPNPGVAFPFRHAHWYDVWDDDPSSPRYNEWVDKRRHDPGANPEPMHQVPAYNYAAVIAYNTARVPGLGSAIFLHVGTGGPTAGCVSLPTWELLRVLRWLRPGASPRIELRAR